MELLVGLVLLALGVWGVVVASVTGVTLVLSWVSLVVGGLFVVLVVVPWVREHVL